MEFKEFGLSPEILEAVEEMGYQSPTPIQEKAIPPALAGPGSCWAAPRPAPARPAPFAAAHPAASVAAGKASGRHHPGPHSRRPTRELALQIQENF